MKLTEEEKKHYYASQGIDRADLLSTDDISLAELPPDVHLGEPDRSIVDAVVRGWNRLDPMAKIDAARSMERRVLKPRRASILDIHVPAEAWAAYLLLGRIRGTEAGREVMQKIGRGELTPVVPRGGRGRKTNPDERQAPVALLGPDDVRLSTTGTSAVRRVRARCS